MSEDQKIRLQNALGQMQEAMNDFFKKALAILDEPDLTPENIRGLLERAVPGAQEVKQQLTGKPKSLNEKVKAITEKIAVLCPWCKEHYVLGEAHPCAKKGRGL